MAVTRVRIDDDVKNVFSSTIYSLGISRDP